VAFVSFFSLILFSGWIFIILLSSFSLLKNSAALILAAHLLVVYALFLILSINDSLRQLRPAKNEFPEDNIYDW
jgi:hypothetical protein